MNEKLQKELDKERSKVVCSNCGGRGRIITNSGLFRSQWRARETFQKHANECDAACWIFFNSDGSPSDQPMNTNE